MRGWRVAYAQEGHKNPCRQRNADTVIEKGPEQILMNILKHLSGKADRRRYIRKSRLHQHHFRTGRKKWFRCRNS